VHRLRKGRARGSTLNVRGTVVALVVAAGVLVADQLTNALVLAHVAAGPHHLFGPLGIDVGRNRGVAFSLISRHSTLAVVVTLVLTVVVVACAFRVASVSAGVVFGLLLGGGLGNDVDRVARRSTGGVVDFLTLPHWPAFNLADMAITFGVAGLLALVVLRRPILLPWRST
jgi:signal peptidase II